MRNQMPFQGTDSVLMSFETPEGGAGAGEGASAPPAGADGQPGGAPRTYTIKVNGQDKTVSLEELRELAQKGDDYTRKTQELAEQRRNSERDFNNRLRTEIEKILQAQQQPRNQEPQDPSAVALQRTEQLQDQYLADKLDRVLSELEKKHGDSFDRDAFVSLAKKEGVSDWKDLPALAERHAQSMSQRHETLLQKILSNPEHPHVKAFKQKVIDEYVKSKTSAPKSAGLAGAAGQAPGGQGQKAAESWEEADKLALASLKAAGDVG